MTMTPKQLKDLFRLEMDDVPEHPDDTSGCLWSDEEIYQYLSEAQQILVFRAKYLYRSIDIMVPAENPTVPLPRNIIDVRNITVVSGDRTYEADQISENEVVAEVRNLRDVNSYSAPTRGGRLRVTLDIDSSRVHIIPPQPKNVRFIINAFVEANPIRPDDDQMDVTNSRHQRTVLTGAKFMAYNKHDSEAYNPGHAEKYEAQFYHEISEIYGERLRRRRDAGTIMYGGL